MRCDYIGGATFNRCVLTKGHKGRHENIKKEKWIDKYPYENDIYD